jgi:dolichol-phosphate mannosyltransferase
MTKSPELSVIVPIYNEAPSLKVFHRSLKDALPASLNDFEIIYINDGSTDDTVEVVRQIVSKDSSTRLVSLSRNFGKENALVAGLTYARGQAVLMIDGDSQHPVELIPEFVKRWRDGAQVVVGIREGASGASGLKKFSSYVFYKLFNKLTDQKLTPGSTDFRLIDRQVVDASLSMRESDRITRGLIDWLGFARSEVKFKAGHRAAGQAGYTYRKLTRLAANSFVSLTPVPLYIFGYLGVVITTGAFLLGAAVLIEQVILSDPWHWHFTGTAMLGILILFLVGIILMSQGILSLYISHIHTQSKARPLFVVDKKNSDGI